jgi:hypothetical protein
MNPKMKAGSEELWFFLGYFVLLLFLLPVHFAFAQYHYELIPSISVSETYDDNINQNSIDKTSDYITGVSPGLSLNILSQKMQLGFSYAPTFVWYANETRDDTIRHNGTLTFGLDLTQHLRFDLTDTYLVTEEPINQALGVEEGSVRVSPRERYRYQVNTGTVSLSYLFGPENSLTAGYRNSLYDNEDKDVDNFRVPDDRTWQTPFATLAYWFNIKNGIELNYAYDRVDFYRKDDFEPRDNYSGHGAGIRYLYRFTPQTTGSVWYDYKTRDFEREIEDYTLHEGSIGLEHAFSPDLSVSLAVGYIAQRNKFFDDKTVPSYNASLMKTFARGSFTVSGSSGVTESVLDARGRGLTRYWRADAVIEYQILEPLRGSVGGYYDRNRDELRREWRTLTGICGLTWDFFRWYSLSLDYSHIDRYGDVRINDYAVNRITLRLTASRLFGW